MGLFKKEIKCIKRLLTMSTYYFEKKKYKHLHKALTMNTLMFGHNQL